MTYMVTYVSCQSEKLTTAKAEGPEDRVGGTRNDKRWATRDELTLTLSSRVDTVGSVSSNPT
jgi:hypothetical protein